MTYIDVTTQAQLDKALKSAKPTDIIVCRGSGYFEVFGSASVRAYGSASVTASGSASVTAYDSASVTAYDSASVTAYGSASVRAYGSASVRASKYVPVQVHGRTPNVTGGVLITIPEITTAAEWLDYHGVVVKRGVAVLYKAVDDDYSTDNARRAHLTYAPGSKTVAPDWNDRPECGGGLHLSPHPVLALIYNPSATKYVACPVKVSEIVLIDDKCKVPRIVHPTYEVDVDGEPLTGEAT